MSNRTIRQAIVLVGGKGTRLGDLTREVPKPVMDIDGRPFLDYLLEMVVRHGYTDIILLAGHLGGVIENMYHQRRIRNAVVRVFREEAPLGTAGGLLSARDALDEDFLMMNGDALFDINLRALEANARGKLATIALKAVDDVSRYGSVEEQGGRVVSFSEKKPDRRGPGKINGGIYVLKKEIVHCIEKLPCSMENDVFPRLVERGEIHGWLSEGYFVDIGIPEALEQGRRELPKIRTRPAVFLNRDDVIDLDKGCGPRLEDIRFFPGVVEAIRDLNDTGYLVVVVTNNAGVVRGYYTLDGGHRFDAEVQHRLALDGAHIDQFYVTSGHPEESVANYAVGPDRKPGPGTLARVFTEWSIDVGRSFVVGDRQIDLEAASGVGIPRYLLGGRSLSDLVRQMTRGSP